MERSGVTCLALSFGEFGRGLPLHVASKVSPNALLSEGPLLNTGKAAYEGWDICFPFFESFCFVFFFLLVAHNVIISIS